MPFYLRKSVSAGPFRFNFSEGGVGLSFGVTGLRIGTGPRGHYVHAGRGGLYYRCSLNRAGSSKQHESQSVPSNARPFPIEEHAISGVQMIEVESADVQELRDEAFTEILDEIAAKHKQPRMPSILGWSVGIVGFLVQWAIGFPGLAIAAAAIPAILVGRWLDSYRRSTVLFYELEPDAKEAYENLTKAFDDMVACAKKWHIEAGGAVRDLADWKRNAGASHLVRKKPTILRYALPAVIKSNVTPPAIHVGRQVIYLFPDVALVEERGNIGAVGYGALKMRWQKSRFIEESSVPRDAVIVDQTWKYVNKKGGPDRRFSHNYQIPVCLYEQIHLSSESGLNELIELSRAGVAEPFVNAVWRLAASTSQSAPRQERLLSLSGAR